MYHYPTSVLPKDASFHRAGGKTVLEFLNNLWGARNRVEIGLSYRAARLQRLAELIP